MNGKVTILVPATLGVVPRFVREGAIIPRGDIVKLNNNWTQTWNVSCASKFSFGKAGKSV